jgi:hypothetical protein
VCLIRRLTCCGAGSGLKSSAPPAWEFWNRDRSEIMLIRKRGKPVCPAPGTQGERMWFARRGEHAATLDDAHSDKPGCALEWFERHWPNTGAAQAVVTDRDAADFLARKLRALADAVEEEATRESTRSTPELASE